MTDGAVKNRAGKFRPITLTELRQLPLPLWLVSEVLEAQGFGVIYGAPGEGKTFVALDLGMCVATGQPWQGREVRHGQVIYVAGEGVSGIRVRTAAWEKAAGRSVGDFFVVREAVQLMQPTEVDAFIAEVTAANVRPALVVIDTLARAFLGGEENLAKDMGELVAAGQRIQRAFGCALVLVHHASKKGKQASERGSSALRGAADLMVRVVKSGDRVTVSCDKQKEGEAFSDLAFTLSTVADVDVDAKGRPVSSCVLVRAGEPKPDGGLSPDLSIMLRALARLGPGDVRKSDWHAGLQGPDGAPWPDRTFHVRKDRLMAVGYVRAPKRGLFVLTPEGHAVATELQQRLDKKGNPTAAPTHPPKGGGVQQEPDVWEAA